MALNLSESTLPSPLKINLELVVHAATGVFVFVAVLIESFSRYPFIKDEYLSLCGLSVAQEGVKLPGNAYKYFGKITTTLQDKSPLKKFPLPFPI